jgi:hypothetical protein
LSGRWNYLNGRFHELCHIKTNFLEYSYTNFFFYDFLQIIFSHFKNLFWFFYVIKIIFLYKFFVKKKQFCLKKMYNFFSYLVSTQNQMMHQTNLLVISLFATFQYFSIIKIYLSYINSLHLHLNIISQYLQIRWVVCVKLSLSFNKIMWLTERKNKVWCMHEGVLKIYVKTSREFLLTFI